MSDLYDEKDLLKLIDQRLKGLNEYETGTHAYCYEYKGSDWFVFHEYNEETESYEHFRMTEDGYCLYMHNYNWYLVYYKDGSSFIVPKEGLSCILECGHDMHDYDIVSMEQCHGCESGLSENHFY